MRVRSFARLPRKGATRTKNPQPRDVAALRATDAAHLETRVAAHLGAAPRGGDPLGKLAERPCERLAEPVEEPGAQVQIARSGAAYESNLPSLGLPDLAGLKFLQVRSSAVRK